MELKTMSKLRIIILISFIVGGYGFAENSKGADMKTLTIRWQRLVDENGQTCERCGLTEKEVHKAFQDLEKSLTPLGIKVILEEGSLDSTACAKDISESNRIWIGDRPLEDWLGALVGESSCEFCCTEMGTDIECRTVTYEGETYETIPANLIVKAGLLAASRLLSADTKGSCCNKKSADEASSSSCCPKVDNDSKKPK
jgi:hypothetical protein